ncbi:MAG: PilZ domain-containing protein [Acidobacteria bacterium]|nr:PilZ domain-containing protein [Acidobacteriota bacterium]
MLTESTALTATLDVTGDRRESERVPGPFDAWRVGSLETPVRIYDLSLGGCFVHAMHEQERGVIVRLKLDLPGAGRVELKAETLYRRPGFGFAVRFIDVPVEMAERLERGLEAIQRKASSVS